MSAPTGEPTVTAALPLDEALALLAIAEKVDPRHLSTAAGLAIGNLEAAIADTLGQHVFAAGGDFLGRRALRQLTERPGELDAIARELVGLPPRAAGNDLWAQ
jgi:hypothetical protein